MWMQMQVTWIQLRKACAASGTSTYSIIFKDFSPPSVEFMKTPVIFAALAVTLSLLGLPSPSSGQGIVINEIHPDEADKTLRGEFIELHNPTSEEVTLEGWFFAEGIDFTFPAGTQLPSGGYLVVAENPAVIADLYPGQTALGPWLGSLKNGGESIVLRDASGNKVDEVTYGLGFPWPTTGEEPSPSIELIHPALDNDLGGSWRASGNVPATPAMELIGRAATGWQYWKGNAAPELDGDGRSWTDPDYEGTAAWPTGQTPIGFGDDDDNTLIDDMQGNYVTIVARQTFELPAGALPSTLQLELYFDDGVVALLNGNEIARESVDTAWEVSHEAASGTASSHEARDYESQQVRGARGYLRTGPNVLTLIGMNSGIGGSDFSLDASLRSVEPEPGELLIDPSPGRQNSVFAENAPPQLRQIDHSPTSPKSGEPVTISAKVTDPDGVAAVSLNYQLVNAGDYIALSDERYATEWTNIAMQPGPDGTDTFSATLPGELQQHRRLIRYRITATDAKESAVSAPYLDDPQPNFAYFVYDQVPAYSARATPDEEAITYGSDVLNSVPVYQLITSRDHHERALHVPNTRQGSGYAGSDYRWEGTMVYDGQVYDHIRYRARGGVWRYAMGKNMWKFDFNRGHRFRARDDYGRRYKTEWDKLNFSACIQQGNFNHRGEQGLFESTGFKLFNLSGVEAPHTHFLHFRVVDDLAENGEPDSQFDTDFQGLYLAIEQPDGRFLEEHGLPDGNFYKIEGYSGSANNQGPTQPDDRSDVRDFIAGFRSRTPDAEWWRANLDVDGALSYHSITEAIHHYDIAYGKNYYYYHNPDTDLFEVHPWDLDLTWADNMFGDGQHNILQKLCKRDPFNVDYQNRMREIMDLLYNAEQTGMLIDEMASVVYQPGQPSMVDVDRAMWDYNPILRSRYVNSSKAGHGRFYREGSGSRSFAGMIQTMKDYVESRGAWLVRTYLRNENEIPQTPKVTYTGIADFSPDGLQFESSVFSSPANATFAGMKWRIAEVTESGNGEFDPYNRTTPRSYEMEPTWESEVFPDFSSSITVPALESRPGKTYRARVRHVDSEGRWSHWSEPMQYVAGDPDIATYQAQLVVSEIMYNPAPPTTAAELAASNRNSDFEYLVLQNIGGSTLDLTNVRMTKGVDFDFATGTQLAAGAKIFLVKNIAAFTARYGAQAATVVIGGEWDAADNLNDGGENLRIAYGAGAVIREFAYADKAPWPESADGGGRSLVLANTATLTDHAEVANWTTSKKLNGSLGNVETDSGYAAWKSRFSVTDDSGDDDQDGTPTLVEYALRQSPRVADPSALLANVDTTGDSLEVSFRWDTSAIDTAFSFQISTDLITWSEATADRFTLAKETGLGDGLVRRIYRENVARSSTIPAYVRLRVFISPVN
ncbi:MAG: hypothetical protein ACI9R3_001068 [Verrucomicrobiales bacterium]|jgi:hypothetical protein